MGVRRKGGWDGPDQALLLSMRKVALQQVVKQGLGAGDSGRGSSAHKGTGFRKNMVHLENLMQGRMPEHPGQVRPGTRGVELEWWLEPDGRGSLNPA